MISASVFDFKSRKIPDAHWWISGIAALSVIGFYLFNSSGIAALLFVIPLFTLLSVLLVGYPSLEDLKRGSLLDWVFLSLYTLSVLIVIFNLLHYRPSYNPALVALALEGIYLLLFFLRVGGVYLIHGGADAKALQVLAILLPVQSYLPGIPFITDLGVPYILFEVFTPSLTTLINAALLNVLLSVIYFSAVNLKEGGAPLRFFFTSRRLSLEKAKKGHWWLYVERDGKLEKVDSEEVDEDGIYWATPKLPFIVFLTLGFVTTLLVGNLLLPLVYYPILHLTELFQPF